MTIELIRGYHNLRSKHIGCVATFGNFDGLHIGHQAIIAQLIEKAKLLHLPALVLTLEPHPREFFARPNTIPLARLTHFREKLCILGQLGIDRVCCLKFNKQLSLMSADDFIKLLVKKLGIKHLVVGLDCYFGYNRSGNIHTLVNAGIHYGFGITSSNSYKIDGQRISSTSIRNALQSGDLSRAARLLGRPYSISGKVIYGKQIGRVIGFPTANIKLNMYIPLHGVYVVLFSSIHLKNKLLGVANIGYRPTISKSNKYQLEVHITDFHGNLYGQRVIIDFLCYIRQEQKFSSVKALQIQIQKDINFAKEYLRQCNFVKEYCQCV